MDIVFEFIDDEDVDVDEGEVDVVEVGGVGVVMGKEGVE